MTRDRTCDSRRLPEGFEDIEQFVDHWSTATSHERWCLRAQTPYPEIVRFYDAMFARAEEATVYLERFPLNDMPEPTANLLRLLLAMCHASVAVEMHQSSSIRHAPSAHALQIVTGFQPHG
ncbi:hypothetical protein E2553_19310 [Paraburkholderia dipogonis]|uniref:Uncharacterized protein n=1 Tax=Paraburkholderia dipogonis TaxID=1211383 RepID=A0A4Y8NB22_9BURK|nr:hypothetical protein [Paraburkholderia dipogonis]TFE46990.1 hypothetical protein E2553_19310 [Paraburkholderia dipogonis]